ncbi:uncharacterized protein LOC119017625 isoform X2 [Acanthopagrus latus]|uniref:uncharacterized protein LOC119017625 isoform X2 n=1 Tax=Acanthopagrus latus TaxID=8177 RepID=UPI00187BF282|nr:uncharacterized protein LOC119017625 isoform X2 [Acanthopagrus latus]
MAVTLLGIMHPITILLCALANQVRSTTGEFLIVSEHLHLNVTVLCHVSIQAPVSVSANQLADILPAKILVQRKTISENNDLYVTCSTVGFKKQNQVYVYLCQNDVGLRKQLQKQDNDDSIFIIKRVGLHHSGNYSCVFSSTEYEPHQVAMRGDNVIQIQVIANYVPADISVAGPSTVSEGEDVELRCSVSTSLQTLDECQFIHSYLMKNESIVQVGEFSVARMEVAFTIDCAVMRDSGHYSCVVLPSSCIQEHKITLQGNNAVLLEVKYYLFLQVMVFSSVIFLILLLTLCLCCINKSGQMIRLNFAVIILWLTSILILLILFLSHLTGCSVLCKPRVATLPADTEMLEEQLEQTEGDDLESQDGMLIK